MINVIDYIKLYIWFTKTSSSFMSKPKWWIIFHIRQWKLFIKYMKEDCYD